MFERAELVAAAYERRLDRTSEGGDVGQEPREAVGRHALGLPLQLERRHRLVLDGVAHESVRSRSEQDLARTCCLLEACGDVDGISGHKGLALSGDDLTRVDPDPDVQAERGDRRLDLVRGSHGTQRVVLVGIRDAEHGHRGIADELLDRAAMTLENRPQLSVETHHPLAEQLWVGAIAQGGRAHEIAKQDSHGFANSRSRLGERSATRVAEAGAVGILPTAASAYLHGTQPMAAGLRRLRNRQATRTRRPALVHQSPLQAQVFK
jgi:hypothetical protein